MSGNVTMYSPVSGMIVCAIGGSYVAASDYAALVERCAGLEADAERWRHARKYFRSVGLDMGGNHRWSAGMPFGDIRGPTPDAAIDAAIAKEREGK